MQIHDRSSTVPPDCAVRVPAAEASSVPCVAAEHWMQIIINEQPAMRVVCTPEHLDELVVGRLITQGIIRSTDDIQTVSICEYGLRARVITREGIRIEPAVDEAADVNSCCTDNRTLIKKRSGLTPVTPIPWQREPLQAMLQRMQDGEPLYAATHAVHACYLARGSEVLCCREDIGRHNALDKVIGWACIHGVDPSQCMLFTTGRMPLDMVSKAIMSGVPVLASKTYPSDLGIEQARDYRLTLITVGKNGDPIVWNDGMEVKTEQ